MTGPGDWLVPDDLAPSVDGVLAPLYEAAARGELAMPFCAGCEQPLELEQVVWEPSLLETDQPYNVIDVELRSGHRLIMTTLEPSSVALRIGDNVGVGFRTIAGVCVPAAVISLPDRFSSDQQMEVVP
jgi:hypothetical protein